MARPPRAPIDQTIDRTMDMEGTPAPMGDVKVGRKTRPIFKKYPEAKIPVPKSMGTLWKSRFDQGVAKLKKDGTHEAWDEAIRYYKNDQTKKRNRDDPDSPSLGPEKDIVGGAFSRTENVVFCQLASALVPRYLRQKP